MYKFYLAGPLTYQPVIDGSKVKSGRPVFYLSDPMMPVAYAVSMHGSKNHPDSIRVKIMTDRKNNIWRQFEMTEASITLPVKEAKEAYFKNKLLNRFNAAIEFRNRIGLDNVYLTDKPFTIQDGRYSDHGKNFTHVYPTEEPGVYMVNTDEFQEVSKNPMVDTEYIGYIHYHVYTKEEIKKDMLMYPFL